tara:strand:- start:817 stop:1101 length:285 start_codon:yes stop_codon:yes gene_type:complete
MNNIKNIGQNCVECQKDTSYGSGLFVNRIPAENDKHSGYMCVDCQSVECDECNELFLDVYHDDDSNSLCEDCYISAVKKGLTSDQYDLVEELSQ